MAQFLEPLVAGWIGADGSWDNGPDRGRVFVPASAALLTGAELAPEQRSAAVLLANQAQAGYLATTEQLGVPAPRVSPGDEPPSAIDLGPDVGTVKDAHDGMRRRIEQLRIDQSRIERLPAGSR